MQLLFNDHVQGCLAQGHGQVAAPKSVEVGMGEGLRDLRKGKEDERRKGGRKSVEECCPCLPWNNPSLLLPYFYPLPFLPPTLTSFRVTTAARGKPLAMGFPRVMMSGTTPREGGREGEREREDEHHLQASVEKRM